MTDVVFRAPERGEQDHDHGGLREGEGRSRFWETQERRAEKERTPVAMDNGTRSFLSTFTEDLDGHLYA